MRRLFLILALALMSTFALAVPGAPTAFQNSNAGTVVNISVTVTITAGDTIMIWARQATDQTSGCSFTDNQGQTYTQAGGYVTSGALNFRGCMFYKANSAAGVTSITFALAGGANITSPAITVWDLPGLTASPFDVSASSTTGGTSATSLTSGAITSTNANDILIYCIATNAAAGGFTNGAGYSIPTNGSSNDRAACQYKIVSAIQTGVTTSISTVNSVNMGGVFTAFKGTGVSIVQRRR